MTNTNRFLPIPLELLEAVLVVPPSEDHPSGLVWINPRARCRKAGDTAGCLAGTPGKRQDWVIGFKNRRYLVSRVIYTKLYEDPQQFTVDHINRDPTDNSVGNLRLADRSNQKLNQDLSVKNTSGVRGVSKCKQTKKWRARIQFKGKTKYLGNYICLKEAAAAYNEEARIMHCEEFSQLNNLNIIICKCNKCSKYNNKKTP